MILTCQARYRCPTRTAPGAVLTGSRSNLVGTNLGAGSQTSSFMGDVARQLSA